MEERYQQLISYLRSSKSGCPVYPAGFSVTQKRALRQQAATFEEKDGLLYHVSSDKITGRKNYLRVVIDEAEKKRLLLAIHNGIDGGHFGRDKTLSKVFSNTLIVLSLNQFLSFHIDS